MCLKFALEVFILIITLTDTVRGQCNLEGARVCLANVSIPDQSTQDIREACQAYKDVDSCLSPFQASCQQDPSYQEMISGFAVIEGYCVGNENCDPTKCYQIMGIDISGASQPSQDTNNCAKYADFKNCVEIQSPACEGNIMFTMLNETYSALTAACTGEINPGALAPECNIQAFGQCVADTGIDPTTFQKKYSCDILRATSVCISKFESKCKEHSMYTTMASEIKQLLKGCETICRIDGCLAGLRFPVDNCINIKNSVTCIEAKQYECQDDSSLQDTINGLNKLCTEITGKREQTAFKTCFAEANINTNCQKILENTQENESTDKVCQKVTEYSLCAKRSLSNCDGEVEEFVTETAKKLSSLRTRRRDDIECLKSSGKAFTPTVWVAIAGLLMFLTMNSL